MTARRTSTLWRGDQLWLEISILLFPLFSFFNLSCSLWLSTLLNQKDLELIVSLCFNSLIQI